MTSKTLEEVLESKNPSKLSDYIEKFIPNNPENLERINHELQLYHTVAQKNNEEKVSHQNKKADKISEPAKKYSLSPQNKSRRLMQNLRDKGINVKIKDYIHGYKAYQQKKKKLVQPLQQNPKIIQNKASSMRNLINRYNINKDYYSRKIFEENQIDDQMLIFLQHRKQLLNNIQTKINWQSKSNKSNKISCKLSYLEYQLMSSKKVETKINSNNFSDIIKNPIRIKIRATTDKMLQNCDKQFSHRDKNFKKQLNQNLFTKLSTKMINNPTLQDSVDEDMYDSLKNLKDNNSISDEQLNRYSHTYMKMVNVIDKSKKSKLNHDKRQLLKNEIQIRKILAH